MNPITADNATTAEILMSNRVTALLRGQSALMDLFHGYEDDRGVELAHAFEREAHALWRDAGMEDMPTFDLSNVAQQISRSVYK